MLYRAALWTAALALLLAAALPAAAQDDVAVEARASANTVGQNETLTYSITVRGPASAGVETPPPPNTSGFQLLTPTPDTRRSFSSINGQTKRSVTFEWRYRPVRVGTGHFGPVAVMVQGETYQTGPVEVRVTQGQSGASASRPSEDTPFEEGDLFIRATPGAGQVYQNEQLVLTYRLYFREGIQLHRSRLAGTWDAPGFWREELDVSSRPIPRSSVENGTRYQSIVLKRVALFPTRTGTLRVAPLRIETDAEHPSRRSGRFWRSRTHAVEITSDPVEIEVKPLPPDAPPGFDGAVGTFALNTRVTPTEVRVGDPVEARVRLSGQGNLATLDVPTMKLPDAFERYAPDVDLSVRRDAEGVRGTKTFTTTFVPRNDSTFRLEPIAFSYFDPEEERYRTLRADPVTIRVTGDASAPTATARTGSGLPANDIAGLLPASAKWVRTDWTPLYRQPWVYAALLLPALLMAGLLAYRRRTGRAPDLPSAEQAHPAARRQLKQARAFLEEDAPRRFYEEVERAVLGFIADRGRFLTHGLTRGQLDARLAAAGVPSATRQHMHDLLAECDRARFAPAPPDHAAAQTASDRAHALLAALDDALA